jgi:hypothetical protein
VMRNTATATEWRDLFSWRCDSNRCIARHTRANAGKFPLHSIAESMAT